MPLLSRNYESDSTPICRCRVLYLGSAVPHVTKDGLQGIQEPLRELYPEQGALGARGIDSWLSVWSNGLLLENVDENHKKVTRFFPIDSLHYCAAVRYVLVPEKSSVSTSTQPRFLPLDSPFARSPNPNHPPLFAAILRRTTGIKVLECHAFICKREVAANALVRCCFHAYADSSYAKQIENGGTLNGHAAVGMMGNGGGGSLYGTLCNGQQSSSNSIEKVEGWRRLATQPATTAGSTLTLNSTLQSPQENGLSSNIELSNSVDDVSIYNGDENHKVWAGSTRDLSADREALYGGEYGTGGTASTMRSSRSNRPRQIMNAPPPPPPPPVIKEEKSSSGSGSKKSTKERSRRKKLSEGSRDDLYYFTNGMAGGGAASTLMRANGSPAMNGMGKAPSSISGGTIMRGYPKAYPPPPNGMYPNGTILRPAASPHMNGFHPIHGPPGPPPPMMMVPTTLPHPPRRISTGSYSHKGKHPVLVPMPRHVVPPAVIPIAPQPIYVQTGRKLSKHHMPIPAAAMEEPIYMPSARPMSPVASYQPAHFPHEAYLMQQYATMDAKATSATSKKKKHKAKKDSFVVANGKVHNHHAPPASRLDDEDDMEEGDSVYNTGIYKRKGHLNERAFSYSIRQEHRSRSYGSLANLKFAPPPVVPNGAIPIDHHHHQGVNKEEIKKEREIMQMMQDLDLSGDELERSEVPAGIYPTNNKMKSAKVRR